MSLLPLITDYSTLVQQLNLLYKTHFGYLSRPYFELLLKDISYPNRLYGLYELRKIYEEREDAFSPTRFASDYVAIQYKVKGGKTREVAFDNPDFIEVLQQLMEDLAEGKAYDLLLLKHKNMQGPIFKFTQKEKDISKWLTRYEPSHFTIVKHKNKKTFGKENHHVFSVYFADADTEPILFERTKPLSKEEKLALNRLQREQNRRPQSQAYSESLTLSLLALPEKLQALIAFRESLPYSLQKLMYWPDFKRELKAAVKAAPYSEHVNAVNTLVEIHSTNTLRYPWINEPFLTEAEFNERGNESEYMRHHLNRLTRI